MLAERGVRHVVHAVPPLATDERTYGESVAAALGVPAERLFKTLVATVDERLVAALVPCDRRLAPKVLARAAGGRRAALAGAAAAERATGYVVGAISPLGHARHLATYADATIAAHETIWVSAGRRGVQIELAPADLLTLAQATLVEGLASS